MHRPRAVLVCPAVRAGAVYLVLYETVVGELLVPTLEHDVSVTSFPLLPFCLLPPPPTRTRYPSASVHPFFLDLVFLALYDGSHSPSDIY